MPLNAAAMLLVANTLRTTALLYAQLHSLGAGPNGTDNVITAVGRVSVSWASPTDLGSFVLLTAITFTGGTPGAPVYSCTLWDNHTIGSGTFYGEFPSLADAHFDATGTYKVTMLDLTGKAA